MFSSEVVITFLNSEVMGSIDDKVRSINVITLGDSFEELRVVHNTFLHEIDHDILRNGTHFLEIVALDTKFVLKLAFFCKELSVISVVKVLLISGERMELISFDPGYESISRK